MEKNCISCIEQLPLEILSEILSYLRIRDVLSSRFVSKKFNETSTNFCGRSGRAYLRLPRRNEIFNVPIGQIFNSKTFLPFSAANVSYTSKDELRVAFSKNICDLYGNRLKSLEVTMEPQKLETFISNLHQCPNIISLEINVFKDDDSTFVKNSTQTFSENALKELKLLRLKKLKVDGVLPETFKFVQFLIESISPIKAVNLQFSNNCLRETDFVKIINLIWTSNFPKLALGLPFDPSFIAWKPLVDHGPITIQKLSIRSLIGEHAGNFDLLTRFLGNCRGLASLTLADFHMPRAWRGGSDTPEFQIPEMTELTKLKFRILSDCHRHQPVSVVEFVPIGYRIFPNLKVITICPSLEEDILNFYPKNFFPVRNGQKLITQGHRHFDQVNTLRLNYPSSSGCWQKLFPNIHNLTVIISKTGQLPRMLEDMPQLTYLNITLEQEDEDVPSVVHEFIGLHRLLRTTQKITIRSCYSLDERVVIMLALLPPVQLTVYNVQKLSDNCISVLTNRHLIFQFYPYFS